MARPLRIEFADTVYHVTSRGDRREAIYRDDEDRQRHLAVIAQAMDRFDAQVQAYCLMGNHYHLVVQTRQANLLRLMQKPEEPGSKGSKGSKGQVLPVANLSPQNQPRG